MRTARRAARLTPALEVEVNQIHGPENERRFHRNTITGVLEESERDLCECYVSTLKEAINFYSLKFGVNIYPYDGLDEHVPFNGVEPKYFYYENTGDGKISIVDIHILLNDGESICPKQNLDLLIPEKAIIYIGHLIC